MFQLIHSLTWRSLASVAAQTGGSSNTPYILQFQNRVPIPIPYRILRFKAGKHIGQLFADATNPHKEVAHELCTSGKVRVRIYCGNFKGSEAAAAQGYVDIQARGLTKESGCARSN